MKALHCKIAEEIGCVETSVKEATHLKIRMPGPVGDIVLPVIIKGPRAQTPCWTWNGDVEKPTLRPSVLTSSGHFVPGFDANKDSCWCKYYKEHPEEKPLFHCYRSHSWINDGNVQFLPDTTHEFSGQIKPLLEIETVKQDVAA